MNFTLTSSCTLSQEETKAYSFVIADTIEAVDITLWNRQIPAANVLMQDDYLRLIESTQKDLGYRYVLVKKDNVVVGAIYFQLIRFSGHDLLNYFPEKPAGFGKYFWASMKAIAKPFVLNIDARLLVSGNIFMTGESGFYFNTEIDKATRAKLLRKAIDTIGGSEKNIKAVVVSDLYEPKSQFDEGFTFCDFNEMMLEPDMSITIRNEWKTFDDYLNSFSSKYRVRAKKVFTLSDQGNIEHRELSYEEIEKHEDRLFNLYKQVMANADFKLGSFTKDYFRLQKQQMPGQYRVFAYFQGDEMLSFITVFCYDSKMDVHYVGMDDERCKALHLYQRMMYDIIRLGIENKVQRLHFGRTAPEIKSTVGAIPSPTYGYLKHFNPIINWLLVRPFTKRLKPKEYVFRHPFKS